jgi:hypothetical protein
MENVYKISLRDELMHTIRKEAHLKNVSPMVLIQQILNKEFMKNGNQKSN